MSAASKYANLPFIASGERDIFETEDLPEADQIQQQQPLYDASVEIIPTGTVDAFQKFANAVNNESLKFEKETSEPYSEKLNRIKREIEELKSVANSNQEVESFENEIDNLTSKLDSLHGVYFKKLDSLKGIADIGKPESNDGDGALVKYELFRKPNQEQLHELNKINAIEQRMNRIENLLGMNEPAKDSNCLLVDNFLKDQSIMNVVVELSNKVVQLDHSSLDKLDGRLNSIVEKLNQISEKRSCLEDVDKQNKLNELHDHYVKIRHKEAQLPNILERLQVLNGLQEHASQFSTTLNAMENLQTEIKTSMDRNKENLNSLKEVFESKTTDIKRIIADFSQRLEQLKK